MKYVLGYLATVAVLWIGWHDARSPGPIPEWVEVVCEPLIITIPLVLLSHLLTRKIGSPKSRGVDLLLLLAVVGAFWALSTDLTGRGLIASPFRFWLRLTLSSWSTLFVPFVLSLALVESLRSRFKRPTPIP